MEVDAAPVREIGPPGGFGEIALLQDVRRTASVIAVGDLVVLALDREHFLAAVSGTEPARRAAHDTAAETLAEDAGRRADGDPG